MSVGKREGGRREEGGKRGWRVRRQEREDLEGSEGEWEERGEVEGGGGGFTFDFESDVP